ncbi:uncharacterized protein LOC112042203 [Lingula anatina]|uniref:Uncharacterized protein LOC112042203 n=1 Tax=Lingula anatina TaxID=7574 RepID=A0A2R2MQ64_LINAN|nr:uncharacterized protein LOC112042203 [Lingula anatina]|eukprot:XP_023932152.1 uncharacterized protein LOC112042203 [Lingula anatina]
MTVLSNIPSSHEGDQNNTVMPEGSYFQNVTQDGHDLWLFVQNTSEENDLLSEAESNFSRTGTAIMVIPDEAFGVCLFVLSAIILLSLLANLFLIATIRFSPSLRTPPNAHLVNICANNMFLGLAMIAGLITLTTTGPNVKLYRTLEYILDGLQLFLTINCFLQYWSCFASIAYYRNRTIRKPTMSIAFRKVVVKRSILISWVVSALLSLSSVLAFNGEDIALALNPFKRVFPAKPTPYKSGFLDSVIFSAILVTFLVGIFVMVRCYYRIFRTLQIAKPLSNNKVSPWRRNSSGSDATCNGSITMKDHPQLNSSPKVYYVRSSNWTRPYVISNDPLCPAENDDSSVIVHFEKRNHSFPFDESSILENPIRALAMDPPNASQKKRELKFTTSNASNASIRSGTSAAGFTDISLGAELHRYQCMKNKAALRKQSLRRDTNSLYFAAKNSIVMLSMFVFCSSSLFVCSIPGVLDNTEMATRVYVTMVCKLLFFVNAPAYPIWYLIFSKRVRKCLNRLLENTACCVHVRQY